MLFLKGFRSGAVSIFMVVFSILVITIITVGFLRLMIADQQQAANNDLSQSAYDSALAGVEDAKRALLAHQRECSSDPSSCSPGKARIASSTCNQALVSVVAAPVEADGKIGEVPVQRSRGSTRDAKLDQAYTCVTITPDTADVEGNLAAGQSKIIPLKALSAFDRVTVSWFTKSDVTNAAGTISLPGSTPSNRQLTRTQDWPSNKPSVMRSQFMQFGSEFTLESFDYQTVSGQSNANTAFAYPTNLASIPILNLTDIDQRRVEGSEQPSQASNGNAPVAASCAQSRVTLGGYACSVTYVLPRPVDGGTRSAFLRLTPFYNATHFKVELKNSSNATVLFDGVQPSVDSTGRANDLFRRVQARVEMGSYDTFPFPEGVIDTTGNICKDFAVTPDAYIPGSCTP